MALKPSERDDLLIRLDERSRNTYHLMEKQERHLATLNEKVAHNQMNIDRNHNRVTVVEESLKVGLPLRVSKKQVAGGSSAIVTVMALTLGAMGKILGWW